MAQANNTERPIIAQERCLMGPGPSNIDPRVLAAMAYPTLGHLDPSFCALMEQCKASLRRVCRTEQPFTLPLSAPGSAAMEACIVNLLEPGQKLLVAQNGVFGGRMAEIGRRSGLEVDVLEFEWGCPVDPEGLRQRLRTAGKVDAVAFVHAETSTGVRSDVEALCAVAREFDALTIVDGVTSLGGIPVEVDAWGIDAFYSGTQKCLSAPPGLAPVSVSERALARVQARSQKVQSWFLDFGLLAGYWQQGEGSARSYHHTAPVHSVYALHAALRLLEDEGLEAAFSRHRQTHQSLAAGLEALGLDLAVPSEYRLPQLNAVRIPDGVDDAIVRRRLLQEFGLEIGGGLGAFAGKVWRIGLMGYSCQKSHVLRCLHALASVLERPAKPAIEAAGA